MAAGSRRGRPGSSGMLRSYSASLSAAQWTVRHRNACNVTGNVFMRAPTKLKSSDAKMPNELSLFKNKCK